MIDFYVLLGISEVSKKTEITEAYQKVVKRYTNSDYNPVVKDLTEVKEILLDDEKRQEYNEVLEEIKYSKQFSVKKEETYRVKVGLYKRLYPELNITAREFYFNYLKYHRDFWFVKFIKSIFCFLNFILFIGMKGILFGFLFLLYLVGDFVDYIAGFIMLFAVLALFTLSKETTPNYIPLIPTNVEYFCMFSIIGFSMEMIKHFVLDSSINVFAFTQRLENKMFVSILRIPMFAN